MKIKLKKLSEANDALVRLFISPMNMDAKIKYRASKIAGKIIEELRHLDTQKTELIKAHGGVPTKDARGQDVLQVPEKNMKAYNEEFDKLLDMEVNITGEKMPFACYEAVSNTSLLDSSIISEFIEEPKENKPTKK